VTKAKKNFACSGIVGIKTVTGSFSCKNKVPSSAFAVTKATLTGGTFEKCQPRFASRTYKLRARSARSSRSRGNPRVGLHSKASFC
jgi:hypothetical protein